MWIVIDVKYLELGVSDNKSTCALDELRAPFAYHCSKFTSVLNIYIIVGFALARSPDYASLQPSYIVEFDHKCDAVMQ
jgi:hypothetical protein